MFRRGNVLRCRRADAPLVAPLGRAPRAGRRAGGVPRRVARRRRAPRPQRRHLCTAAPPRSRAGAHGGGARVRRGQRIRIVILEVRRSNRAAIKLYRSFGFTALSVRPGYYADNDEDAVEMIAASTPPPAASPGRDEIRIDG